MSYLRDRLPEDIAVSVLVGLATAVVVGLLSCAEATREFSKAYPHDGQNGLGGFLVGLLFMLVCGPMAACATLLAKYLRYRKLGRLEEDIAFEAELLAARSLEEKRISE